jgi:hypothetical protein
MNTKYSIETRDVFCDFYNKNIKMTIKVSNISESKIHIEKRCSEWENCKNRNFCKHGKI